MKIHGPSVGFCLIFYLLLFSVGFLSEPGKLPDAPAKSALNALEPKNLSPKLPLAFIENHGQMDEKVRFYISGPAGTIFFTPDEIVSEFIKREKIGDKNPASFEKRLENLDEQTEVREQRLVLRKKYLSANPKSEIIGGEQLPGKVNILRGNDPSKWKQNISTFKDIRYKNIYPGIDMVFRSVDGRLKYDYIVAPKKQWNKIQFQIEGVDKVSLTESGDLALETVFGTFHELKPIAYQEMNEKKVFVSAEYRIQKKNRVGLKIGKYDRSRPLIIDPLIVTFDNK